MQHHFSLHSCPFSNSLFTHGLGAEQDIEGVPKLTEGLNPATWVLQISTPGMERGIGVDFAEVFERSDTYKCVLLHPAVLFSRPLPPHKCVLSPTP